MHWMAVTNLNKVHLHCEALELFFCFVAAPGSTNNQLSGLVVVSALRLVG